MLYVSSPSLTALEREYLLRAYDSGRISGHGEFVDKCELKLSEMLSSQVRATVVNNGTSALHLALMALGIGPGDEVIVPSFTYIASVNAILYVGATPVFVDSNPCDLQADVASVEAAISDKTAAIMAVHLYGFATRVDLLREIADRANVKLVEDVAEAFGATLNGAPLGTFGDVATYSFFANKLITSGEGGAVLAQDPELDARLKSLRNQGMSPSKRFWFDEVGNNFRLPNPLAAILLAQLERFEELFRSRAKIVETYTSAFEGQEKFELQVPVESSTTSPWLFSFQVASKSINARERLMNHLEGQGVETRPYFYPAHSMPPYQDFRLSPVFDSERLMDFSRRGLNLPTSSSMVPKQALWVANEALSWND